MDTPKKVTAYDLPIRIFHWLFALAFLAAYLIAISFDDEHALFPYHKMAGLTLALLLVLRLAWGVAGTTYARFSSFRLNPKELIQYFRDAVASKTKKYVGHNPASSYAAIIMFLSAAGLAATGILMTTGYETDFYEETHELLAHLFLITVIVHVGGILFHRIRHRDSLWTSMLTGNKTVGHDRQGIQSTRPLAGFLLVILIFSWIGYLANQYNSDNRTLTLFGNTLTLGENEHENHAPEEEYDDD